MQTAGKIWGKTATICAGPNFELHRIEIKAGGYCSKHRHATKSNGFFCESGSLEITTWKPSGTVDVTHLNAGDFTVAPPGEYHQFHAPVDCTAFEIYWTALDPLDIDRENTGGLGTKKPAPVTCPTCGGTTEPDLLIEDRCPACWKRWGIEHKSTP